MPDITVEANNRFPDIIEARSLFIDHVSKGGTILLEIKAGGNRERQLVRTTSKILSIDAQIEEIVFINVGDEDIDVSYHYSTLINYDETPPIIDDAAQRRVDKDENVFSTKLEGVLNAGNYATVQVTMPANAEKNCLIERVTITEAAAGQKLHWGFVIADSAIPAATNMRNHKWPSSAPTVPDEVQVYEGWNAVNLAAGDRMGQVTYQFEPTDIVHPSAPLLLSPGAAPAHFVIKNVVVSQFFTCTVQVREVAR